MTIKAIVIYATLSVVNPTTPNIIVEPKFVDGLWCEENADKLREKFLDESPDPSRYLSVTVKCGLFNRDDLRILFNSAKD